MLPYSKKEFSICIENKELTFSGPADLDEVLNSLTEEQYSNDQFQPYWAEFWPSAEILLKFIKSHQFSPETLACELGCGLGIVSSVLAHKGCNIISTDISSMGCRYAFSNLRRNGFTPRVFRGDWSSIGLKNAFDLVAASDVLYESRMIEPVLKCIKEIIKKNGKAWIADPCRRHWEDFKVRASVFGFKTRIIAKEMAENRLTRVEILELSNENG